MLTSIPSATQTSNLNPESNWLNLNSQGSIEGTSEILNQRPATQATALLLQAQTCLSALEKAEFFRVAQTKNDRATTPSFAVKLVLGSRNNPIRNQMALPQTPKQQHHS
jgi:hypothetical protein